MSRLIFRKMRESDYDQLYEMGKRFMQESDLMDDIGWEPKSLKKLLHMIVNTQGMVGIVAETDKLIGMMVCVYSPHLFNNDVICAEEMVWWIDPPYRNKLGREMLELMEEVLKAKGVKYMNMKYLANESFKPKIMERMYRQRGYTPLENLMRKEL